MIIASSFITHENIFLLFILFFHSFYCNKNPKSRLHDDFSRMVLCCIYVVHFLPFFCSLHFSLYSAFYSIQNVVYAIFEFFYPILWTEDWGFEVTVWVARRDEKDFSTGNSTQFRRFRLIISSLHLFDLFGIKARYPNH